MLLATKEEMIRGGFWRPRRGKHGAPPDADVSNAPGTTMACFAKLCTTPSVCTVASKHSFALLVNSSSSPPPSPSACPNQLHFIQHGHSDSILILQPTRSSSRRRIGQPLSAHFLPPATTILSPYSHHHTVFPLITSSTSWLGRPCILITPQSASRIPSGVYHLRRAAVYRGL